MEGYLAQPGRGALSCLNLILRLVDSPREALPALRSGWVWDRRKVVGVSLIGGRGNWIDIQNF